MRAGFTGTQHGASSAQLHTFRGWLLANMPEEFHHGCCVGADTQANYEAHPLVVRTVFHWPTDTSKASVDLRTWAGEHRDPKPYLVRNRAIVAETDLLIAMPNGAIHMDCRHGTCYTVRHALSKHRRVLVIDRDGHVKEGSPWT